MSRSRRLKVAVVGTGFVGPHHVDAVQRGGYADVVALVSRDPDRGRIIAESLGVPRAVTDLSTVLADPSIDVVHVCTPNRTHVELASAIMRAGKHVVLEKPIALDRFGAATLLRVQRETGQHAATALTYRGYPMIRRAHDLVHGGRLGSLRLIHGGYLQDWLSDASDYNWRVDAAEGGVSRAFADIGTHWFDTAEFVSGCKALAVNADFATLVPVRDRPRESGPAFQASANGSDSVSIDTEDAATVLVRFSGGAHGSVVVSQVSPGHKNNLTLDVSGSERSLRWAQEASERLWIGARSEALELTRGSATERWPVGVPALPPGHPEGWGEALRDLFRPFYAAIAAGDPAPTGIDAPYPTLSDGARSVALIEAVVESSRRGLWVDVRPVEDASE